MGLAQTHTKVGRRPVSEWQKNLLVCDNLNIHTGAALYELLPPKEAKRIVDRLEFRYAPKHGSWLNIAEIELRHFSRQSLNRRLKDMLEVKKEVEAWLKIRNEDAHVVDWLFGGLRSKNQA